MLPKNKFYKVFSNSNPGEKKSNINLLNEDIDIYFEPLSLRGLTEMYRYSKDARLYEFFEFDSMDTIEKTADYIKKLELRMAGEPLNKTAMYWFVRRKYDNYLIGSAALLSLNYERQSVDWGYAIDPELWGLGYILQIQELLKYFVFEQLELNRLAGTTMVTNQRTIASLITSGMKHEGNLRNFYCKNGEYIDAWQYSMLKEEYFELKNNFQVSNVRYSTKEIVSIISSVLTEEEVTHNSSMFTLSSWDSFAHMSIMIEVTKKTGIVLTPAEVSRANSVKALTKILEERGSIAK